MDEQKVDTLLNLAMKRVILSWKFAIDKFEINDMMYYDDYETVKNFVVNSKDVTGLVKYHEPHREFLHSAKRVDHFMSHFEEIVDIGVCSRSTRFSTVMFWLCFLNKEVSEWKFWYPVLIKDSIIYSYLKKHDIKLSKCKTAAIELEFKIASQSTVEHSIDEIKDLFTKIPNIEDLRLGFYHNSTSIVVNKKIMTKILPKFQFLKAFKIRIGDSREIKYFCQFIKKSPKIIQHLEISHDDYGFGNIGVKDFKKMMNVLTLLPQLVTLNIDFGEDTTFSRQEIETFKCNDKLKPVKNMTIWIKDGSVMNLISRYICELRSMKIIMKDPLEVISIPQKLKLENHLIGLTAFNQVETLTVNSLPFQFSAIWKIFPNLKEFKCDNINLSRKEVEDFSPAASLEKLSLRNFHPIELLLKFPNLKCLQIYNFLVDDKLMMMPQIKKYFVTEELVPKIQLHLPANCKISRVIDPGTKNTRAPLVPDTLLCWWN